MDVIGSSSVNECIYCRENIEVNARVCPKCGLHQSNIRNTLVFLSGVVGLVAFLGSSAIFLFDGFSSWLTRNYGADIQVRNVSSIGNLTVFNNSDEDVILNDLLFVLPGDISHQTIIDVAVGAGKVAEINVEEKWVRQTSSDGMLNRFRHSVMADHFIPENEAEGDNVYSDILLQDYENFTVQMLNKNGSDYKFFIKFGSKNRIEIPCEASLAYQVVRGEAFSIDINCVGIVRHRKNSDSDEYSKKKN